MNKTDLDRTYAGAIMIFHTDFERALEELFVGLLTGQLDIPSRRVKPIVRPRNQVIARQIIKGGRSYVDWLPFNRHTQKRAGDFLVGGRPFDAVAKGDVRFLEQLSVLRNALAHRSAHSLKRFHDEFIAAATVGAPPIAPPNVRPVDYLRGQHAADQTRLEFQLAEATAIFRRICDD